MNNLIPEGWFSDTLSDKVDILSGFPFKSSMFTDDERQIGLIRIRNLTKQRLDTFYRGEFDDEFVVKKGDVLISMDGDFTIVKWKSDAALLNQRICKVEASLDANFDTDFLFYFLQPKLEFIHSATGATTVKHLSVKDIRGIESVFPPLPEQKKIAAILTSVDDVIEKTQAQIDKLKDLKTAMMQELLTRGVGVDGKPHTDFKDSPVGRIPKGWDCCLLDKVARRGSGHTPDKKKSEYWNDGVKWVSLTDSSKLDKLYISDTAKKISQLGIENSSATLHPKGTVVMARDAGVGKSAIMTSSMAVSQHFMAWVCGEKLDNYFLYYLLQHWKPQFEAIAMGSTIKTIGLPYFKKLQIPVPSIEEQRVISGALKSVDNKMFALERKHKQLTNTKKALMQDLLSGKVRVKADS